MTILTFEAKLRKVGTSYVITVPMEEINKLLLKNDDVIEVSLNRVVSRE
jgi:antitoxin component of MazEF toxin-antitoxin module